MTAVICTPYGLGYGGDGVCIGLEVGGYRLLLDCGLRDVSSLLASGRWDGLICSHAHDDHMRGIRAFQARYPEVPIYASAVTAELLRAVGVASRPPVLAGSRAAGAGMAASSYEPMPVVTLPWQQPIQIAQGLTLTLWAAGHLPGAASCLIEWSNDEAVYRIFYTGDCFLSPMRLVEGMALEPLRGLQPDLLIAEGSLGGMRYPQRRQQENQLAEVIRQSLEADADRCLLFPVPRLGLGQELLMLLRSHYCFTGYPLTIWVDEVVGHGCDIYLRILASLPQAVQNFASHQSIFWDDRVAPWVKRLRGSEQDPFEGPTLLVVHPETPLQDYCDRNPRDWTIFLPEAEDGTEGASPLPGQPIETWLAALKGTQRQVKVNTYTLASHCDQLGSAQLIHNLKPKQVLLIHGQPDNLQKLAQLDSLRNRYPIHLFIPGQPLTLTLSASSSPSLSQQRYGGEMVETIDNISIELPTTLTQSIQWRRFSETGLIEARWQGDDLLIQGISPADLGTQSREASIAADAPHCVNCIHRYNQRCRNPESPLFQKAVTADGSCLVFEHR